MLSSAVRLKSLLGVSTTADDELFAQLVDAATGAVQKYCHRPFERSEFIEYHDGDGCSRDLILRVTPVVAVLNVWLDSGAYGGSSSDAFASDKLLTQGADYMLVRDGVSNDVNFFRTFGKTSADPSFQREWDTDSDGDVDASDYATYLSRRPNQSASGRLRRIAGSGATGWPWEAIPAGSYRSRGPRWPYGQGNVKVHYVGGYTQETVPEDLRMAVDLWAKHLYLTRRAVGVITSESLGEASISYAAPQMSQASGPPPGVADLLRGYIDRAA